MGREERSPALARTEFKVWRGLVSNADRHDLPAGAAQSQENIECLVAGQLTVRKGIQPSTDYTPSSPTTNDLIALFGAVRPEGNAVYIADAAGNIKIVRSGTATTLASSRSVITPPTFAKHRRGHTLSVSGWDRGVIHNGTSTSLWELGVDEPSVAAVVTGTTGGAATAGDYLCTYRWVDGDKPNGNPSTIAPLFSVTMTANQKFLWTITAPTQGRLTMAGGTTELWRTTMGETNLLYLVATLGSAGTITSGATNGGFIRFTLPAGHGLITGAKFLAAGTGVVGYNTTHTVTAYTSTTVTTDIAYSSDSTGGTWTLAGFTADTFSDDTLESNALDDLTARLPVVSGTRVIARRFTKPPNYMRVAVPFQDRICYFVPANYSTGTISTSAGSTSVTGSGTAWTTAMAGRYLYCKDIPEPMLISSVGSATSITLSLPCSTGVSGKTYAIRPRADANRAIVYSETDEPESVPTESDGTITNIITIQNNTGDDDEETGLIPFGSVLYAAFERHIYAVTFFQQPKIDASVSLLAQRGMVNQQCYDFHEGTAYVLDRSGPYALSVGGDVSDLAEPIRNMFRDTTFDWTKKDSFHVRVDPIYEKAYFFLVRTADSSTRPKFALVFCIRSKTWTTETYSWEIGASGKLTISNAMRLLLGGEDDSVCLANEGTTDWVTSEYLATVTSASSGTTITCSGASFTAAMIGAPVVVYSGTGKASRRRITARTSTTLTIDSALTVDTTSLISVGGIPWSITSGILEVVPVDVENERGIELTFAPTSSALTMDLRKIFNHESSAESNTLRQGIGTNITRDISSADDVVSMQTTALAAGTSQAGWARALYAGRLAQRTDGKRWFAVQLRGVAGAATHTIYHLNIVGAANGSD